MGNRKRGKDRLWTGRGRSSGGLAPVALVSAIALIVGIAASFLTSTTGESGPQALRISEVVTSGVSTALRSDWVELENVSNESIDLAGCALLTESRPTKILALRSGRLEPGERLLVMCDGDEKSPSGGALHAPFRLSAAGETLVLLGKNGASADSVAVPALADGQSYCRDDGGEWAISDYPTPGERNDAKRAAGGAASRQSEIVPGALEITEVMSDNATFFPDEKGEYADYVEIHNATDEAVDLNGWCLSDDPKKPDKWRFPAMTLPGGGYLAIHCSGASSVEDAAHLHAGFRIGCDGEALLLTDPDGATVSRVSVPALSADEAYSLTETGWQTSLPPSPGYANDVTGFDAAADAILSRNGSNVYITEVMASASDAADWIELYNAGMAPVDLNGFGLSDNAARPRKWRFPQGTSIKPGQYLVVMADGGEGAANGMPRAGFKLSADGGYSVTLSDAGGRILDRLYVPIQIRDISYGRQQSLSGLRYFAAPTPGSANAGTTYYGRAPQPTYSVLGGLYRTGDVLSVSLSAPSDCRIRYTLDCTDPTEASPLYTGPISISGTTILRTRVYRDGCMPSVMDAQSYLYDVNNGGGTIYVSSMVSDPHNLTDEEYGIMAMGPNATSKYPYGSRGKGANFWMDWEREGHIEVFHPDGSALISQECGIKLHGTHSRPADQKPFKVIARSAYGSNRFEASIFTRRDYTEYQSFVLRTGSQDAGRTRMRDAVLQQLAAGTRLMYQEYEIGVLYLNGSYWGQYNLRERINTASICQWEGWEGDEDALDLVKGNSTVMQGSDDTMQSLIQWLKGCDLNSDEAYQAIDAAIDIDNFIEYMAIEMYTGNTDTLNMKRYRNPNGDGKWRWILFDLDCGFDIDTDSVNRWLDPEGMGRGKNTDNRLFVACMRNDRFRQRFLEYLGEQMATTYSAEHVVELIEAFYDVVKAITPDHLARWGMDEKDYRKEMEYLVSYANSRPERMLYFLKIAKNLSLTREEMERYFGEVLRQTGYTYDTIPKKSSKLRNRP